MIRLLQPWLLAPGVIAAIIVTALHFLVRSPVRREPLPTQRFLSPAPHAAVRVRRRPHDLLLLALRVLFALSLAAAFARPVWTASTVDGVRIMLLDRGAGMAGVWDAALDTVSARLNDERVVVIVFDTAAVVVPDDRVDVAWIEELREAGPSTTESDYRIAFHALAREAGRLSADTYEATLMTSPRWSAWREGTASVRAAAWPGLLEVVVPGAVEHVSGLPPPRVFARPGSALFDAVEVLGMTAVTDTAADAIRIIAPDSGRSGGVNGWAFVPGAALAMSDLVVFAGGWTVSAPHAGVLERSATTDSDGAAVARAGAAAVSGHAIAAWRDGAVAAVVTDDAPCTITTAFDPDHDALTTSPEYPELIRNLVLGCSNRAESVAGVPLDSGAMRTLRGTGDTAVNADEMPIQASGRPLGTLLLLIALLCAVVEWLVRRRGRIQDQR